MKNLKKAETIILIEKLRLVESELFRLASKYGVKTIQELDNLVVKGKLSEETIGDNLFIFDNLLSEKEKIQKAI